jgi:hypothetical protein
LGGAICGRWLAFVSNGSYRLSDTCGGLVVADGAAGRGGARSRACISVSGLGRWVCFCDCTVITWVPENQLPDLEIFTTSGKKSWVSMGFAGSESVERYTYLFVRRRVWEERSGGKRETARTQISKIAQCFSAGFAIRQRGQSRRDGRTAQRDQTGVRADPGVARPASSRKRCVRCWPSCWRIIVLPSLRDLDRVNASRNPALKRWAIFGQPGKPASKWWAVFGQSSLARRRVPARTCADIFSSL